MDTIECYGPIDPGGVGSRTVDSISESFAFRTGFFGFTYPYVHSFGCGDGWEWSYRFGFEDSARRSVRRSRVVGASETHVAESRVSQGWV